MNHQVAQRHYAEDQDARDCLHPLANLLQILGGCTCVQDQPDGTDQGVLVPGGLAEDDRLGQHKRLVICLRRARKPYGYAGQGAQGLFVAVLRSAGEHLPAGVHQGYKLDISSADRRTGQALQGAAFSVQ